MLKKAKKPKNISYYEKKADKLLQEVGRKTYSKCEVCGEPMSCLHHYYPKSTSTYLRYDWKNLIPLCQNHHFAHHNGNPDIHNAINLNRGEDWLDDLQYQKSWPVKNGWIPTISWIKNIIESLKLMLK